MSGRAGLEYRAGSGSWSRRAYGVLIFAAAACGGLSTRDDGAAGEGTAGSFGNGGESGSSGARGGIETAGSAPVAGAAGSGGSSGDAGTSGTAGSGQAGRNCGPLIDDMEQANGRICAGEGRVGNWYAYNDGIGVQLPPPEAPGVPILPFAIEGGRGASRYAMHSFHTYPEPPSWPGLPAWGAGIGVDLAFDGVDYGIYDASRYDGITFWIRAPHYDYVEVRLNTKAVTPVAYGGVCPEEHCGAFSSGVHARPEWGQVTIGFGDLPRIYREEGAPPIAFDPSELTNIQFLFVRYPNQIHDGEIWVDDLSFYQGTTPSP